MIHQKRILKLVEEEITLPDFFKENRDYKTIILDEIKRQMREQMTADKYEVAPGYMGVCEFEIPFSLVKDILKPQYQS